MNVNDIEFAVLPFKAGWYWSRKMHKMFFSDNIENIVYEAEDIPVKMQIMKFPEMIEFVKNNPGDSKAHRTAIMRIVSDRFALKENNDNISKWNNVIYVDLDMKHWKRYMKLTPERQKEFYNVLDYTLQCICPDNYFYIEHSSSLTGIHCMFYFDCNKTDSNYSKYAQYVYEVFRYKISEMNFIKDFSLLFDPDETDGDAVWDEVYKRPYQKLYITTIDCKVHNCSGYCDDIVVNVVKPDNDEVEVKLSGTYDVQYKGRNVIRVRYMGRFNVVTALKKYVGDEEQARKLWYEFCNKMIIAEDASLCKYRNEFDKFWNSDSTKPEVAKIDWLRRFGFNVDDTNLHIHLKDDQYISDVVGDITSFCVNGLNLLISGTGTGKTEVWKNLYKERHENAQKPILIVEPMNSIVNSKYDSTIFEKVIGNTHFSILDPKKCYITNYNHLLTKNAEGKFEIRKDIVEFFGRFELVIIDESHIMMKDKFRSDVLIPFMQTLNMIDNTKVILQTATPLFERTTLNIRKTITIHKAEKAKCKIIYRQMQDRFNILQIMCLVNYYIKNGRKTYIYWKDGSYQNMNMIKEYYPDAMVVYHKRANDNLDMQYINEEHNMQKWDVMISSVYFGVGNDLNDNEDKAAVVVIGNNVWQEDIQAKGRWRNCKDIEMCIVLKPNEIDNFESACTYTAQWSDIYEKNKYKFTILYNDKINRDKSVLINNATYDIKDASYIEYLAKMAASNEYSAQISVKNREFKKLGYDVRETIKPLETNDEWVEECKAQRKALREARRGMFKDFFNGVFDWGKIQQDGISERCARTVKKLRDKDLIQYCDLTHMNKTHIYRYSTFLQYYCNEKAGYSDYGELMALLYVRNKLKEADTPLKRAIFTKRMFNDIEIDALDYYCIYGYSIWLTYRNKGERKEFINYMYYDKFRRYAGDMYWIEDSLMHRMFVKWAFDDTYKDFIMDFLNISDIEEYKDINENNLIEYTERLTLDDKCMEWLRNVGSKVIAYITNKKAKGGMKTVKKCTITDKFKSPETYNMEVGRVFESATALSEYTKKSLKTISQWRKKGWIT